jgi:hypothetical protein
MQSLGHFCPTVVLFILSGVGLHCIMCSFVIMVLLKFDAIIDAFPRFYWLLRGDCPCKVACQGLT